MTLPAGACLLDELETAGLLELDGLFAEFSLVDAVLDRADQAAEAGEPFASEETALQVHCMDGRTRRQWAFSYNALMEAQPCEDGSWLVENRLHLRCLADIAFGADDADEG